MNKPQSKNYVITIESSEKLIDWDALPKAPIDELGWSNSSIDYMPITYAQAVLVRGECLIVKISTNQVDMTTNVVQNGGPVHEDGALEFFVSMDNCESYMNFEANATGVCNCSWRSINGSKTALYQTDADKFSVSSQVSEDGWKTIYRINLELFSKYFRTKTLFIDKGFCFFGNFYHMGALPKNLVDSPNSQLQDPHFYMMWNRVLTDKPNFHRPDFFGNLSIE